MSAANEERLQRWQREQSVSMSSAHSLRDYLWGAAFIVMIVWLLIVLFGKTLIRGVG